MELNLTLAQDDEIDAEVTRLMSSGVRIPPQPKIVLEVSKLAQQDDFDLRQMGEIIGRDAGLIAMLYKLTRSAAFSRGRSPQTVDGILSLVGVRQTAMLVQAYGLTAAVKGDAKVLEQFWARSSSIAQIAALIAAEREHVCRIHPEQAYLAGIFHDCGVPVLRQRFPDYCGATGLDAMARKWADVRAEDRAFHVDHCSIGFLLARHWRLPAFIAQAILLHHERQALEEQSVRALVAVLQFAIELFSQAHGLVNPDWLDFEPFVLDELGIHPDDLLEFSDGVLEEYRALATQ